MASIAVIRGNPLRTSSLIARRIAELELRDMREFVLLKEYGGSIPPGNN